MRVFISTTMHGRTDEDIKNDIRKTKAIVRALVELPTEKDSAELVKTKMDARKLLLSDGVLGTNIFCEPLSFVHSFLRSPYCHIPKELENIVKSPRTYFLGGALQQMSMCDAIARVQYPTLSLSTDCTIEVCAALGHEIGPLIDIYDYSDETYYKIQFKIEDESHWWTITIGEFKINKEDVS